MHSPHANKLPLALLIVLLHTLLSSTVVETMSLASAPKSKLRIELFFKGNKELKERVRFLSQNGVASFNLVNKNKQDTMEDWVNIIRHELPTSSICAHYSLKYNRCGREGEDETYQRFKSFIQSESFLINSAKKDLLEVLLVSGSGDKAKLDPIKSLERLGAEKIANLPTIAVAFNPFFPSEDERKTEISRLIQKLDTKLVDKVYLQFGTNLKLLRSTLDLLSDLRSTYGFAIIGSIFLSTKKLIAQQKFRPWNGVFLSEDFLASPDNAHRIVVDIMRLYEKYDCEILIEAPGVRNEKDISLVEKLLKDRDSDNNERVKAESTTEITCEPVKRRKISTTFKTPSVNISPSSEILPEYLNKPAIVLFGSHDVRIHDNEAIQLASLHSHILPVFLWNKSDQGKWGVKGALEIVLKDAIRNLKTNLQNHGLDLICRNTADIGKELINLCDQTGCKTVYWNKEHIPESRLREEQIQKLLMKKEIYTVSCQSSLLYDPDFVSLTGGFNGGHWGTLMPFLKGCKKQLGQPRRPLSKDETSLLLKSIKGLPNWPVSLTVDELNLGVVSGTDKWNLPILECFSLNEENAMNEMESFMKNGFLRYEKERSRADLEHSTSRLSPHLRLGTLSPNELYYKVEDSSLSNDEKKTFSRRLFWRDLAYYHLLNFPNMRDVSIRGHYEHTEWCDSDEEEKKFEAWKTGQTGYPLVDAGMRELYKTGWLTQSVRMVVASFLTEYLRVNWVKGCEWFHYTLVDADSAINAMMWQNAGRSGIDQWNFVMSPVAASQDPTGQYTKKWVPELSKVPKTYLHKPWDASDEVLATADVVLGDTYPTRIVTDLKLERAHSVTNVLNMRRNSQQYNDEKGYDLIILPSGKKTVVFTKKEYRIDRSGKVIPANSVSRKQSRKTGARGRRKSTQNRNK